MSLFPAGPSCLKVYAGRSSSSTTCLALNGLRSVLILISLRSHGKLVVDAGYEIPAYSQTAAALVDVHLHAGYTEPIEAVREVVLGLANVLPRTSHDIVESAKLVYCNNRLDDGQSRGC